MTDDTKIPDGWPKNYTLEQWPGLDNSGCEWSGWRLANSRPRRALRNEEDARVDAWRHCYTAPEYVLGKRVAESEARIAELEAENAVLRAGVDASSGPYSVWVDRHADWAVAYDSDGRRFVEGDADDVQKCVSDYSAAVELCRKGEQP